MSNNEFENSTQPRRPIRRKRAYSPKEQEVAANLLATGYTIEEAAYIAGVKSSEIREWYSDKGFKQSLFALKQVMTGGKQRNPQSR